MAGTSPAMTVYKHLMKRILTALALTVSSRFARLRRAMRRRFQYASSNAMAREAQGRRRLASRHRPGLCRHHARPERARLRPPPARHVPRQELRGIRRHSRHRAAHQARAVVDGETRSAAARIERQFGVPARLVMAIWTLETDNGTGDIGKLPVVRTLATLAHDCRRTELFQNELIAALQIVQRGDLPLRDMVGAFAGEIGQTQFLPSSYIKYGVDYRRQRPCRPAPFGAGRAGLHRQSAEGQRLATRRAVRRRHGEFPRRCASGTAPRSTARPWC